MKKYLIVVLLCILILRNDIEQLLAICMSSLEKHLFISSADIFIRFFFFAFELYELFNILYI